MRPGLELRQLQHFVAVAEEAQFTRAARRVNIVQSALSASIRALEDELGSRLFIRSTRQVRLTAVGRALLDKARMVLEAARDARETVAAMQGRRQTTLTIGSVQSLPAFLDLPNLLTRFHRQHPGIEVRLCQGDAGHLLDKIRDDRLDFAILPLCDPPADIATRLIACESLVLATAPGHPLAGRTDLPLEALRGQPFVDFAPAWGTRHLIDRSFAAAGLERHIAFEVSDLETLLELVARGLGVALVPQAIAEARRPQLAVSELAGPEMCWELLVAHADPASHPPEPAALSFLDLLVEAGGLAGDD